MVLTGLAPATFGLMVLAWTAIFLWTPRAWRRKLGHLPPRRVTVELTEPEIVFQTATERLAIHWSELKAVRELPGFVMISLKSSGDIPVPRAVLTPEFAEALRNKADVASRASSPHSTR